MKTISQTLTREIPKLKIYYDESAESPREYREGYSKLCIRKNRKYDFPNELDFDIDKFNELNVQFMNGFHMEEEERKEWNELNEILKPYYIFNLDFYSHGNISFSLAGQGMKCNFDTSPGVGFIAIPKEGNTLEEAEEIAGVEIEEYNKYLNGEVYGYTLYGEDGEIEDSCGGFYDMEQIKEQLPEEWKDENLYDYYK